MTDSSFVHLHVHSEYSLLDGACRVDDLCRKTADDGLPGVALTDHGVMYGAVEFHDSAKKHGLTPIIGCEAYIAPRGRADRTVRDEAHITLLAADDEGYKNLTALISKGFLEGYYYKPRIDLGLLEQHNRGLIVLSGCMSSLVAAPLIKNDRATSLMHARALRDIFGDRFYIEIMRHGMPEEEIINAGLIAVARELDLPLVATNDSHYLSRGDAQAHDVLLCIGTGKTVADTSRMKFFSDEFYVKSAREMRELFADVPEACDNTLEIVKRIDLKIPEKVFYLPDYVVGSAAETDVAMTADEFLREQCEAGLTARYGEERARHDPVLRERLEYELGVIVSMGFSSYFLIVWDFIKFARDHDIPVGPGRGSAVGSVVSYCLRITDLDPIKFNLIFERFLNPERISMPDIDTDFCVDRRDEVIAYVTEKYGQDRVAQIVTFGTMAARAAVRDAGRALAVPLPDVDRVAKLIPSGPGGLSIKAALVQIPELKALYNGNPQTRKLIDTANSIEGLARHASTHAAGVVISKNPLTDHVPLVKLGEGDVNTQYDMTMVERIGLLKFDFLGLRNLTVMKAASDEIRRTQNPDFDLAAIPDDDARTYEMLGRGETLGVFQLESDGMKRVCVELKPTRLDDIIALVALYRPGPMDWIPQYIRNKHGRASVSYLHPKLEPILQDTYGIACLRVGTPVWYADGTVRPIEKVQPGDDILTYGDGVVRQAKAAKTWPSGKKDLLRITLSTGTVIECSEEHRFPTPAGDLFARDLRVNRRAANRTYDYTQTNSILFEAWARPQSVARGELPVGGEHAAYVLGMLLGDSGMTGHSPGAVTCETAEDAEFIGELMSEVFECEFKTYFHTRAWYARPVFRTAPFKSPLRNWLDALYGVDAWRVPSPLKFLPDQLVSLSDPERIALLRGFWDSDGSYSGSAPYFRSTSPRLCAAVAALLASFKIAYYVAPTAVRIQDRARFAALLGRPWLPSKRLSTGYERDLTASAALGPKRVRLVAPIVRRRGPVPTVYRTAAMWPTFARSYEELYLGDARPVFIETIERIAADECFDLQMKDQRAPYFIANGVVTHNCYQEQIMQIARDVAGFSMGQADELRKVMGKKQKDMVPFYKAKFMAGCEANGISKGLADEIFAFIEPFAGYGFNKSHAAAYGWISYQTAYLKANYPLQYFAALMSSVRDKTDKLVEYIDEAKKMGIAVLPPDVNQSLVAFAVVGAQIRFGLAAVKGIGEGAVAAILAQREAGGPFADLFDVVTRVGTRAANRKVYEALVKCGALDTLPGNRAQLLDALDGALEAAARASRDRELGQASLFGMLEESAPAFAPVLRALPAPSTMEALTWEKETLGIFVSGHPLADVADALARAGATPIKELRAIEDDAPVRIAGLVTAVRRTLTKAQAQMLIATVEDTSAAIECIVFPKSYAQLQGAFVEDAIVTINGRLRLRERRGAVPGEETPVELGVSVNDVQRFERHAPPPEPAGWHVTVATRDHVDALAQLLEESPGTVPLVFHISGHTKRSSRGIANAPYVRSQLERIVGPGNVRPGTPAG